MENSSNSSNNNNDENRSSRKKIPAYRRSETNWKEGQEEQPASGQQSPEGDGKSPEGDGKDDYRSSDADGEGNSQENK